ncbi:MAG: hypothetical protein A3E80_05020 [Chlamydiae bacterium RIFCSPHIGHO2_12_FULL_49_9]|nr:MAG: hypothetical protein A3E80_05020 [Chlamydiae bacterium RIFCSPHIGHO2_12_FULL_49_9]
MNCWKCRKDLGEKFPILFRTVCPHCDIDLHVCKNCKYYTPGKPNDCAVPGTDYIRDREMYNFCEEFRPKGFDSPPPGGLKKKFDSLFKD